MTPPAPPATNLQTPGLPQTTPDTAAPDSVADVFTSLGEEVSSAGRLLMEGDWGGLWTLLVDGTVQTTASLLPRLVSAAFVATALYVVYRVALGAVERVLDRARSVSAGIQTMVVKTLRVVGLGFVALVALSQVGVNISAVIAGLGIAGIAVGFAAKDSLANFIAGVTILLDAPFQVGDWVLVGSVEGEVVDLTLRSTRIRTRSREIVVIPNEQMVNQPVTNQSGQLPLRVQIPFGIAYKEDIDRTREVVLGLATEDDRLARGREPRMVVTGLGNSSVDCALWLFTDDAVHSRPLHFDYTERIRKALAKADIEIPFPHLQLFIDEAEGLRGLDFGRAGAGRGD